MALKKGLSLSLGQSSIRATVLHEKVVPHLAQYIIYIDIARKFVDLFALVLGQPGGQDRSSGTSKRRAPSTRGTTEYNRLFKHCSHRVPQAIFELITTEADYVRDLQLIVEVSRWELN